MFSTLPSIGSCLAWNRRQFDAHNDVGSVPGRRGENSEVGRTHEAEAATMAIRSNGAGGASDTDTLAIFRGTFEGP